MASYLRAMEASLSEEEKQMLREIYEPTVVAVPLSDSRRDICILPDGEIRSYGVICGDERPHIAGEKTYGYLSSRDGGLTWKRHFAKGAMKTCTYLEKAKVYIASSAKSLRGEPGVYVWLSQIGPGDENPMEIKVCDDALGCVFLPVMSSFGDRIWFTAQDMKTSEPWFFYSDDFGKSWNSRKVELPQQHEVVYPHKDVRWNKLNGTEPYAIELSEKKMMMLLRNSTDCFYQSFSYDGGDTWSQPEPSVFYGVNTTPFLLRLSDGRVVVFWNNTKSLPEVNHRKQMPYMGDYVMEGFGEDAFTNRDAAHAAITEDQGENWIGFREILLNPVRNAADFRYVGGVEHSNDKSVHQFQAFELPFGKILVSAGQNIASRRMVIFDLNWLYEKTRREDFLGGLKNVSTHVYVKSVSGSTAHLGNGHCAWNRTNGALMMPDPEGGYMENLLISKHHDDRLFNDIQGVVWNFPMSRQGTVDVRLQVVEKQIRIALTDRWYNPCDPTAAWQSPFWFEVDTDDIGKRFVNLSIQYDTESGMASVTADGRFLFQVAMRNACETGISYLMIQCATDGDSAGAYIRSMEKR